MIDLLGISVAIGQEYYIQFVGFEELAPGGRTIAASPFIRCLRVTAFPTAIEPGTWTNVKRLFR